jgi:subtilisin family serine protease
VLVATLPASAASAGSGRTPPAPDQPYLGAIGEPAVFPPLRPVKVGVIDSGIDGRHPDLAGRIVDARAFGSGDPLYPNGTHGTATAGLIAAVRDNGIGIDGIAPNARLLVADVSGAAGSESFDEGAIERAIRWAAARGARVISLSLEVVGPGPGLQSAIDAAVARGTVVVAAAGNCWQGAELHWAKCPQAVDGTMPAWLPHVLGVGATDDDYAKPAPADYSVPSGRWVDLAAPGNLITTLWPTRNNPYADTPGCIYAGTTACYWTGTTPNRQWGPTGTSYATPMVAAAAAILIGADPQLQPGQVARLLEETAQPLPSDPEHQAGAGVLDVGAALARVRAGQIPPADADEPNEPPAPPALLSRTARIEATVDWTDDPEDVYLVRPGRTSTVTVRASGSGAARVRVTTGGDVAAGPLGRALRVRTMGSAPVTIHVTAGVGARVDYSLTVETAS